METKHIEAPWCVTALGDASYRVESHTHTDVFGEDENGRKCVWSDHSMATASLIAAAPQLLEFAQFVIEKWGDDGYGGEFEDGESEVIDKARAVIAKATAT